jgi:transposase
MAYCINDCISINIFADVDAAYYHREPVDFRKSINSLSIIVEQSMTYRSLIHHFIFFNKQRHKLKVLYWDSNGFCLCYKRLEKEKLK